MSGRLAALALAAASALVGGGGGGGGCSVESVESIFYGFFGLDIL